MVRVMRVRRETRQGNETEENETLRLRMRTLDWEALWLSYFIGYLLSALYTRPVNTQRNKKGVNGTARLAYRARKGGKGHWGQEPVSQPGTSQIHHKEMDNVLTPIPVGYI